LELADQHTNVVSESNTNMVSPGTTTLVVVVTPHCCFVMTKDLHFIQHALVVAQETYMNVITRRYSESPIDRILQKEIDLV